jgi:hypothetical protein
MTEWYPPRRVSVFFRFLVINAAELAIRNSVLVFVTASGRMVDDVAQTSVLVCLLTDGLRRQHRVLRHSLAGALEFW